ncbi:hypothetical protein K0M31_010119 [Melipona bicolor]|uniref:Uncharacterized protein n=1 Tax=Melipona bicolor TaxID=60889 RepID=A0AA40FMB4_9HYME|nr:hypothetical protein K0M31_010119 [Melipona bicolor]
MVVDLQRNREKSGSFGELITLLGVCEYARGNGTTKITGKAAVHRDAFLVRARIQIHNHVPPTIGGTVLPVKHPPSLCNERWNYQKVETTPKAVVDPPLSPAGTMLVFLTRIDGRLALRSKAPTVKFQFTGEELARVASCLSVQPMSYAFITLFNCNRMLVLSWWI